MFDCVVDSSYTLAANCNPGQSLISTIALFDRVFVGAARRHGVLALYGSLLLSREKNEY